MCDPGRSEQSGHHRSGDCPAQETNQPLWFLYVVNLSFLSPTSTSRVRTITELLEQMGESVLQAAGARADTRGVKASKAIRHGDVGDEVVSLCPKLKADCLVLDHPEVEQESNVFARARLVQFRQRMDEETGARLVPSGVESP
jgi:hypothetical protein